VKGESSPLSSALSKFLAFSGASAAGAAGGPIETSRCGSGRGGVLMLWIVARWRELTGLVIGVYV